MEKHTEKESIQSDELLKLYMEFTPTATAMCDMKMRYLAYSRRWIIDYNLPEENLLGRCHYDVFETIPESWKAQHNRCSNDNHWTMELIGDEIEAVSGYPASDFLKNQVRSYASIIHPDDTEMVNQTVQHKIEQKSKFTIEYRIIRADGDIRWVLEKGQGVMDKKGEPAHIDGIILDITDKKKEQKDKEQLIEKLEEALNEVKTLTGLLPICAKCKKIRDDKGYWNQIDTYIQDHSDATFSHSMCPECSDKIYGDKDWYIRMKKRKGNGLKGVE